MNSKGNALLTGATSGLGKRLARYLAEQGYNILLHYHSDEAAVTALATELVNEFEISASICPADFLQTDEVNRVVEWVAEHPGKLQAVIHTVGPFGPYAPLQDHTLADYDTIMNGNLRSTFQLIQGLAPLLQTTQAAAPAHIITFAAATAEQIKPRKFTALYHIAKAGVIGLTESYAHELAGQHIKIHSILPGILEESIITEATPEHAHNTFNDVVAAVDALLHSNTTGDIVTLS